MSFAKSDAMHTGGGWGFSRNESCNLDDWDWIRWLRWIGWLWWLRWIGWMGKHRWRERQPWRVLSSSELLEACVIMRTGFLIKNWLQGILACLPVSVRFSLPFHVRWKLIRRWSFPQNRYSWLCLFFGCQEWLTFSRKVSAMDDDGSAETGECRVFGKSMLCDDIECFLFANLKRKSWTRAAFSTMFEIFEMLQQCYNNVLKVSCSKSA